jgi:hypothetical protein
MPVKRMQARRPQIRDGPEGSEEHSMFEVLHAGRGYQKPPFGDPFSGAI